MQTLLTGFGPFGRVVRNPTERLARCFAEAEVPGQELTTCTLPVSFARAAAIMRAQIEVGGRGGQPFDTILMLGLATGSPCWRVERFGRNRDEAITDAENFTPAARIIVPDAPETLSVTVPADALLNALTEAGLPAVASDSAGGYLCNHVLFTTLHTLRSAGHPARAGFLHVPADEQTFQAGLTSATMFPFARHVEAVRAALAALTEGGDGMTTDNPPVSSRLARTKGEEKERCRST
jgi:pyroglutamyl-peptidase